MAKRKIYLKEKKNKYNFWICPYCYFMQRYGEDVDCDPILRKYKLKDCIKNDCYFRLIKIEEVK